MGFDSSPINGKGVPNRGDEICPIDGTPMKSKTMIAAIPRQTHTEIRKVHATCVPVDSRSYPQALALLGITHEENKEE